MLSHESVRSGVVTETTRLEAVRNQHGLLSKVPEVTVWFWIIKILCLNRYVPAVYWPAD